MPILARGFGLLFSGCGGGSISWWHGCSLPTAYSVMAFCTVVIDLFATTNIMENITCGLTLYLKTYLQLLMAFLIVLDRLNYCKQLILFHVGITGTLYVCVTGLFDIFKIEESKLWNDLISISIYHQSNFGYLKTGKVQWGKKHKNVEDNIRRDRRGVEIHLLKRTITVWKRSRFWFKYICFPARFCFFDIVLFLDLDILALTIIVCFMFSRGVNSKAV